MPIKERLRDYFANSTVALALASASGDKPLILVNDKFTALTGYAGVEIEGRNCRFLQTSPEGVVARNDEPRRLIHEFLSTDAIKNLRTPIVNFRKDGKPFVNLLFMSKMGTFPGDTYIFASQFDVSRTRSDLLEEYDHSLSQSMRRLTPIFKESGLIFEGTLTTVANSAAMIAQAKLTLADLEAADAR